MSLYGTLAGQFVYLDLTLAASGKRDIIVQSALRPDPRGEVIWVGAANGADARIEVRGHCCVTVMSQFLANFHNPLVEAWAIVNYYNAWRAVRSEWPRVVAINDGASVVPHLDAIRDLPTDITNSWILGR